MNKIILISILLSITVAVFGQQKNFIDENYIEVTGSAEMEVTPDEIYIEVFISEKDEKRKETIETLEKKIFAQLTKAGVNLEANVFITNMTSSVQYRWLITSNAKSGKEYQILAHDAATVESIYQLLKEIGVHNMYIAKMRHSKIEEFRRQVKINALKAAKEKASDLAEAIGQKVGKAIHITEALEKSNRLTSNTIVHGSVRQESKSGNKKIEFEKINIRYEIGAKFRLE